MRSPIALLTALALTVGCDGADLSPLDASRADAAGGEDAGSPSDASMASDAGLDGGPIIVDASTPVPVFTRFEGSVGTGVYDLMAIAGSAANDLWTVTDYESLSYARVGHYDGAAWSDVGSSGGFYGLFGVWAASPDDVWAVGGDAFAGSGPGVRLHWDGAAWSREEVYSARYFTDVHGTSGSDVWLVSAAGTIEHFDGESWTVAHERSSTRWVSVFAYAPDQAWALGANGELVRYDGGVWTDLPQTPGTYHGLWVASPTSIHAVGNGSIDHFDGTRWARSFESSAQLYDVYGTGDDDVWAVGWGATVLHYDGSAWTAAETGGSTASTLYGVWASSASDVWAVGSGGTVLHHDGSTSTR